MRELGLAIAVALLGACGPGKDDRAESSAEAGTGDGGDMGSQDGGDAGTKTADGGTASGSADATTADSGGGTGGGGDGTKCVSEEPCGHELLCCDGEYCRAGDCLDCLTPGSPCEGNWLGEECCQGACVMQDDGTKTCA